MRAPVEGGPQEQLLAEPGVEQFVPVGDQYYYVAAAPNQGPFRAPRKDPSQREAVALPGAEDRPFGVYATLHTWTADPEHVYALGGSGYWKIAVDSGIAQRVGTPDFWYMPPTQTTGHLNAFFATNDFSELRSCAWDTGRVRVIDQESFRGIAEDDSYFYIVREGALLRFPR